MKDSMTLKLDNLLMQVEKPARYIGGELNSVTKPESEVNTRFIFAFPDTYEIGMSCLGMQIIYQILNRMNGVQCERIFAPAIDMETKMRKDGVSLFSLETKRPVKDADIIGFTLQYEMSYSNVINMLDLAGIPILSSDRNEDYPLIMAGGPCCFNIEPMADIFDLVLVGDGEEALTTVMETFSDLKGKGRAAFLKAVSKVTGVYVPCFYEPIYGPDKQICRIRKINDKAPDTVLKAAAQNLDETYFPEGNIVPFIDIVHDRATVEIFRGCSRGCRFCQAGMIYRPVRERSPEKVKEITAKQLKNTGYEEISLLSLSTSDYSHIESLVTDLMSVCKDSNVSLSVPSLRLDSFSFSMLKEIQGYKKSGLTFAPEAGTQRLRDVINKSITEQDIYDAARQAISLGWMNIKLYFMVGLPTETEEDLDGIVSIARHITQIYYESRGGKKGGRFNVTVSVSNFVPKPHTPFQWFGQNEPETLFKKHMYLKEKFRGMKNVTFNYHDNKTSFLEAVFARGDRRLVCAIIRAWELGCKFDGWGEHFKYEQWIKAFEETGIDPAFYAQRQRDYDEILPWDVISTGVNKKFLIKENEAAKTGGRTRDCRKSCEGCGVSDSFLCLAQL